MSFRFSFTLVLVVGLTFILGSLFIEWLNPPETTSLYDNKNNVTLAQGANTLWIKLKIWVYFTFFIMSPALIGWLLLELVEYLKNLRVEKLKQQLQQEINVYEKLQKNYKEDIHKQNKSEWEAIKKAQLAQEHANNQERQKLKQYRKEIESMKEEAKVLAQAATNTVNQQIEETKKKLHQTKRLKKEKQDIVSYLNKVNWKIGDKKLTYQELKKRANEASKRKQG